MDNESKRLMRKILADLDAIHQALLGINDQCRSAKNQQEPPRATEVSLVPPASDYYASEQQERPIKNKRERNRLILEVCTLIAAIIAAGFTGLTVWEFHKQTPKIAESADAAVSANRAWIVPDPPPTKRDNIAESTLEWHNVGKSPAVAVFSVPEYFIGEFPRQLKTCAELRQELNKHPLSTWQYQGFVPAGGRYETGLSNTLGTPTWIGQQPISIHGCVWYTDVLTNTERTTEFFLVAFQLRLVAFPKPIAGEHRISLFYLAERPFIFK